MVRVAGLAQNFQLLVPGRSVAPAGASVVEILVPGWKNRRQKRLECHNNSLATSVVAVTSKFSKFPRRFSRVTLSLSLSLLNFHSFQHFNTTQFDLVELDDLLGVPVKILRRDSRFRYSEIVKNSNRK